MNILARITLAFSLLLVAVPAQDKAKAAPADAKKPAYTSIEIYPLTTCVVSGKTLEAGKAKTVEVKGRTYMTCCDKCPAKIEASPEEYSKKLDAAIVVAESANYPLKNCPVSGEPLGSMGEPKQIVVGNHLVKLCCGHCTDKAEAKKAEIWTKIQTEAYAAQKATYSLKKCPISGDDMVKGDEVDVMIGTTLVRTCCSDCIDEIKKEPAKAMAKITAALAAGTKPAEGKATEPRKGEDKKDGKTDKGDKKDAAPAASECCGTGEKSGGCCEGEKAKEEPAKKAGGCCEGEKAKPEPTKKAG